MELDDIMAYDHSPFVIYGAQVVAYGAYKAIWYLYKRKPEYFIVSTLDNNPDVIEGIPVYTPEIIPKEWTVIVGVTELLQDEIVKNLQAMGITKFLKLTQSVEHSLMARYFEALGNFKIVEEIKDKAPKIDFVLYEIRNHRDKKLYHPARLKGYERSLQAGSSLTNRRIAELTDDSGENISERNVQYCEMTGSYWVWKNTSHDWVGIEHYRRHLLVSPEMITDDMDAIMPLPYMSYPNVLSQFKRFVSEDVVELLINALKILHPDHYDFYMEILNGQYQYTYNLVSAKKEVFDDYCRWFFEITAYMEQFGDRVPDIITTRALSYVAEVLTNIYFMSNQSKLKIRHVGKAIYV